MKVYFDTSAWMRLYDEETGEDDIQQREALGNILDKQDSFELISSLFQTNQFNHMLGIETQENRRGAIVAARETCKQTCGNSIKGKPYCETEWKEFMKKTRLNDDEDGYHIVIAWIKLADYFVTTDYELWNTKKILIKKVLSEMHPPPGVEVKEMEILDPREFVKII